MQDEPRFMREYGALLHELGDTAFRRRFNVPVLIGVSLYGEVADTREARRRTLGVIGSEEYVPAGSILDRVWPIAKARQDDADPHYVVLGQRADCDLVIPEYTLSSRHCAFTANPARPLKIADLGSRNGTRLDGKALPQRELAVVRNGALLIVGRLGLQCLSADGLLAKLRGR